MPSLYLTGAKAKPAAFGKKPGTSRDEGQGDRANEAEDAG
jgi:hypothetical protein